MINKLLHNIEDSDIQYLISNNVLERRTLEYKSNLPDNSDNGKKEVLADVSSFANTVGGDLIFGIKETNGVIENSYGLSGINADAEIARLENILRDGISPRIKSDVVAVNTGDAKSVFVIRIDQSLEGPHRVIFKSHDKFYARNSNGKYSMDVFELRGAFARTSAVAQSIKDFRSEKVFEIKSSENFIGMKGEPFIALHIVPLSAFTTNLKLSTNQLLKLQEGPNALPRPLYAGGWSRRINLLGVLGYTFDRTDSEINSYTQVYREGIIECVDNRILSGNKKKTLPMFAIEDEIIKFTQENLKLLSELGFQKPFYLFLSIGGIRGFSVLVPERYWSFDAKEITYNDLLLPEAIIDTEEYNIEHKMRPIFDIIWNASGISRSLNFDDNDNFLRR